MHPAAPIVCALAFLAPLAAEAELYRWVDDRGVVNYSNIRPEGVQKVAQLAPDSRVTTIPGVSADEAARLRQRELEARIERLERELDEARARSAVAVAPAAYPYPAYDPWYAAYPAYAYPAYSTVFYGAYYPAHFRGYGYRFAGRPVFPPRVHPVGPSRVHAVGRPAPVAARGMRR
jgi:hypothetical protein